MTRVFDDALLERAAREAERALAARDPDTLAGRFSLGRREPVATEAEQASRPNSPRRQVRS